MTTLYKYQVSWSGLAGLPGTTTLYSLGVPEPADVKAFFTNTAPYFPSGLTWTFPNFGDTIESTTGALTGSWSSGSSLTQASSGPGTYPAPAGACVSFTTSTIVGRRRLRGRMFLVPLAAENFAAGGVLSNTRRADIETRAQELVSAFEGQLVVWSRPIPPPETEDDPDERLGSHGVITGTTVSSKVVTLRSRRD